MSGSPAPLGIGKIELESEAWVMGFICEGYAAEGAADISGYGGWRSYIKAAELSSGPSSPISGPVLGPVL
jgi:allophanate hydrolase